ncbi:MAG: response regulator [Bacteroidales bacterium]|nr:response regulator [Bacteroidales bacterium]
MLRPLRNRILLSLFFELLVAASILIFGSRFYIQDITRIDELSNTIQKYQVQVSQPKPFDGLKNTTGENLLAIQENLGNLRMLVMASLNRFYIYSGISLFLFTLLIGVLLSQHITRPLKKLSDKISRFLENKSKWQINIDFKGESSEIQHFLMQFEKLGFYIRQIIRNKDEVIELLNFERIHYHCLLECLPIGVFEADVDGKIVYANPYFLDKFQYDIGDGEDDFSILNLFNLLTEKASITGDTKSGFIEFEAKRKDGNTFPAFMSINRINHEPSKNGYLGIIIDITHRKDYIRNLKKEKEKAEKQDKEKSAFLANVSHEIRTPLNGILGFSELLADPRYQNEEEKKQFINQIRQSSEILIKIINDLIDFTKIEAGKIEIHNNDVDIHKLLEDIYEQFKHIIEKVKPGLKIFLQSEYMQNLVTLTDKQRLSQIINNLIGNAIKFTSHGSVGIIYGFENNNLIIKIRDTGIGIPSDKQEKIFERFAQADNSIHSHYGGAGLGLAISKQLIELMGGKISLVSEPGTGSTFKVTLPVTLVEEGHQTDETPIQKKFEFDDRTILLVENNDASFELLQAILKPTGALVIRACDGNEALKIFTDYPNINLILINIGMPGLNGIETIRKIRKLDTEVPIIVEPAYALKSFIDEAMQAGGNDFIIKPILKEVILEKINYFLEMPVKQR